MSVASPPETVEWLQTGRGSRSRKGCGTSRPENSAELPTPSPRHTPPHMKRYQALADDIARSIRQGLLSPGQRLPSVRQASAARQLSPSTVFQAYYLLEAQGLVESRARSGYYVSEQARALPPEPDAASQPDGESRPVDVSELVFEVLESAMAHDIVPLGSAFMSPALFPLAKLGRAMAHEAV